MAQFRGTVKANGRTKEASRLAGKKGMTVSLNGWNGGIRVEATHDELTGRDVFRIFETKGSNGGGYARWISEYCAKG